MNIVVLPQAADEFEDAAVHYEDKQPGLGQRFRDEVDRHICWIAGHGEVPRLRPRGYRRVNLKIFPHYVAYTLIGETVWILAIVHGHREPEYWIGRRVDISQPDVPPKGVPGVSVGISQGSGGPPSAS
jgi:plasmid stabilization system protein ParE